MPQERFTTYVGVSGAYKDKTLLEKRKALYQYTHPSLTTDQAILRLPVFDEGQNVIDLGCGNGALLVKLSDLYPTARLIGLDISQGIVAEAHHQQLSIENISFLTGDIQTLPFTSSGFDRVLAIHMLYHVPDIDRALQEVVRILKPDGWFIASANSIHSKSTLAKFKHIAATLMNRAEFPDLAKRFNIENGTIKLQRHFEQVRLLTYKSTIRLTTPDPYVDYFDSTREFWNPSPTDQEWGPVIKSVRQSVQSVIRKRGVFTEENIFGIFVASEPQQWYGE